MKQQSDRGPASSQGNERRTERGALRLQPLVGAFFLLAPVLLGNKGCEVANIGSMDGACGVRGTPSCETGEFCKFEVRDACGAADAPGTCTERPEACTQQYDPVCGCDGETYGNACAANVAGVSVATSGACAGDDPPGDDPDDDLPGDDPDDDRPGDDPVGDSCGGLQGLACGTGEFCDFARGDFCGAADAMGTCRSIPEACTRELEPVCGCDDQTYGNACEANAAGVSVASDGECDSDNPGRRQCGGLTGEGCDEGEFCKYNTAAQCGAADATGVCQTIPELCPQHYAPVCGCDGQTYGNECEADSSGVSIVSRGECDSGEGESPCGGLLGSSCLEGEFCNYPLDAICGAADATGICETIPEACTQQYDPVCGCDDKTYGNACEANAAGVSVASEGPCDQEWDCGSIAGLACDEGEFCDYAKGDGCDVADGVGVCSPIPDACDLNYAPVCGCDGMTYGNVCAAHAAGISVLSEGECDSDE